MATNAQLQSMLANYRNWLRNQGIGKPSNYSSWLANFPNKLSCVLPYPNYLDTITDLCLAGHPAFAVGVCDVMLDVLQKGITTCTNKATKAYLQNAQTALNRFRDYLTSQIFHVAVPTITSVISLGGYHIKISKEKLSGSIDGTNILIGLFNSLGIDFIKLAIESSLFFSDDIVQVRCKDMRSEFSAGNNLPARYTYDKSICPSPKIGSSAIYTLGGTRFNVIVDPDGNYYVRQLINKHTGYTVSSGKKSIITGYEISHIWGRAFDPKYFSSFWNIVLIPSWANPLMDIPNPPSGSYASRLQNTIMAICKKLYASLTCCSVPNVNAPADVVHGTYDIPIINPKGSLSLGNITRISVTV